MKATREDVIACYKNILGRDPENEETLSRLIGWDFWALVHRFSHSDEQRAKMSKLSGYSLLKFRSTNYLARNISAVVRLSSTVYNYALFRERFDRERFLTLMEDGLRLIDGIDEHPDLSVDMSVFGGPVPEGEVSLILSRAGRRLAVLTFTAVRGEEFGLTCETALLISRIQGYRGAGEDALAVRRATDVAPPLILMAVLEGVADALGIKDILGLEAHNHPDFKMEEADRMKCAYDALFASLSATRHLDGFYHLALPRAPRPIGAGGSHRARSKRRRAVRGLFTDRARERVALWLR